MKFHARPASNLLIYLGASHHRAPSRITDPHLDLPCSLKWLLHIKNLDKGCNWNVLQLDYFSIVSASTFHMSKVLLVSFDEVCDMKSLNVEESVQNIYSSKYLPLPSIVGCWKEIWATSLITRVGLLVVHSAICGNRHKLKQNLIWRVWWIDNALSIVSQRRRPNPFISHQPTTSTMSQFNNELQNLHSQLFFQIQMQNAFQTFFKPSLFVGF